MSHSETPRTDAHLADRYGKDTLCVVEKMYGEMECDAWFAQQLERELASLKSAKPEPREITEWSMRLMAGNP